MTTGKGTYKGLAVPLFGESEILQSVAGTDVLTITSVADATAANHLRVNITSTSAITTGYTQGVYVNMNLAAGETGGYYVQANAFAADITLGSTVSAFVGGAYMYFCEGSTTVVGTSAQLVGYTSYMEAYGSVIGIKAGFWAGSAETSTYSTGDIDSAFVAECGGASSWGSMLHAHGGYPTLFLKTTGQSATGDMFSTDVSISETKTANLKCSIHGTVYYIALFASCAS